MIVIARGDQRRAMGFGVLAAFLLAVRPDLGTALGWFADPLGRPGVRPIGPQNGVKVRLETVADGLTAPLTRVSEAEGPSPCR